MPHRPALTRSAIHQKARDRPVTTRVKSAATSTAPSPAVPSLPAPRHPTAHRPEPRSNRQSHRSVCGWLRSPVADLRPARAAVQLGVFTSGADVQWRGPLGDRFPCGGRSFPAGAERAADANVVAHRHRHCSVLYRSSASPSPDLTCRSRPGARRRRGATALLTSMHTAQPLEGFSRCGCRVGRGSRAVTARWRQG